MLPLHHGPSEREPPAGFDPAPRPYKGRWLAVDTTEARGGRPGSNRRREDHNLECCRYTTATMQHGDGRAAFRLTSGCSSAELRPRGSRLRGQESNLLSRAHEAREMPFL